MITLYGFGRQHRGMMGKSRDLRAQWALEETRLPYRVHGLDFIGGEPEGPTYSRISWFHQVPAIDDDGFIVAESGAVLLYIAEKAGKLIPGDFEGRMRVVQWCFAALTTVEPPLWEIQMIDAFGGGEASNSRRPALVKQAERRLADLEGRLDGREWIACADFTVADILLAAVLRQVRKIGLIDPYPRLKAYYARAFARPAWERTLETYAERLGVPVADIR
jgi:glutathione S-transferase